MKEKLKKYRRLIAILALGASVPATLHALDADALYEHYYMYADTARVGSSNTFWSSSGSAMAIGYNNVVGGSNSLLVGDTLHTTASNAIVVGKYNEDSATAFLAVGNGPDYMTRRNAFEVHSDGRVIVNSPQGDVSMGEFTN